MSWRMIKDGMHLKEFFKQMMPHIKRIKLNRDLPHAFTNIFVEAARLHAYHAGHIWMVQTLITIGVIIWILFKTNTL